MSIFKKVLHAVAYPYLWLVGMTNYVPSSVGPEQKPKDKS